jgi:dTDP-4-amino-4,6-dideoxygalactose transaminase
MMAFKRPLAAVPLTASPPSLATLPVARPMLPTAQAVAPYLEAIDRSGWYSNFGPMIRGLEQRLAERLGPGAHVTTGSNATQLITLTLQAMGLAAGSLCIVPSWTFVATAHAVIQAGLLPWFVDVDPQTGALDPQAVLASLDQAPSPVSALIVVAPHGHMPPLDAWCQFRNQTGIEVIVDAAAAFDAVKACPLPTVISLHATKALGIGEGGYLAHHDEALVTRVRQMTSFGFLGDREAKVVGTNAKLSEFSGAVGMAALDRWPSDRSQWMARARLYRAALGSLPCVQFQEGWGLDWISSVCVVTLAEGSGSAMAEHLLRQGIETRQWWGAGCHMSRAFRDCPKTALPVTEHLAHTTLGLPFWLAMTDADINRVATAILKAFGASA